MTEYLTIEKFNGQFIGYVKKYPCLYDPQAEDYNNKAVTEVAWYEIARHFNMPGKQSRFCRIDQIEVI